MADSTKYFSLYNSVAAPVIVCLGGQSVYANSAASKLAEKSGTTTDAMLSDPRFRFSENPVSIDGTDYIVCTVQVNDTNSEEHHSDHSDMTGLLKIICSALCADSIELYKNTDKARRRICYSREGVSVRLPRSAVLAAGSVLPPAVGSVLSLSDRPALGDHFSGYGVYDCLFGRISDNELLVCSFCHEHEISQSSRNYFGAMCRHISSMPYRDGIGTAALLKNAGTSLLDNHSEIVTVKLDRELNIIELSGSGVDRISSNPDKLIGHSLYERDYSPEALAAIEHAFSGSSGKLSLSIGERHFDTYYSPIVCCGETVGLYAVLIDITDRAALYDESASNIGSMDVVARSMRAGFWSLDLVTGTHTWDEGCYHLWGLHHDELPINDETLEQIFPEGDWARLKSVYAQAMSDPSSTYFHFRFTPVVIDGETRYIDCRGKILWENGEPVRIAGMTTDITDSIELEEKLEYEAGQNVTLMNISIACAYSEDIDEGVRFAIIEAAHLLGAESAVLYTADEESELWQSSFFWSNDRSELQSEKPTTADISFSELAPISADTSMGRQNICRSIVPGDKLSRLFPGCSGGSIVCMISDEPGTRSFLWIGRPIGKLQWRDEETGFIMTIAGVLQMALKKRKMDNDLRAAVEAANAGNKAKSDFLSQMSHEICTPMNAVLGMSRIAMESENLEEIRTCLRNVEASGTHLLGIINDILDISKIEAGKMELELSDFSLPELISNVSNMIGFAAANKGLLFVRKISADIPKMLHSDSKRLRQVLINLLNNAIKFTSKGQVTLELSAGNSMLHFKVSDTGIGIKDEDRGRLFGAFEQLDRVTNRGVSGTGLGLMITKSIVDMMGGSITLDSVYGEGTTFYVDIPYEESSSADSSRPTGNIRRFTTSDVRALVVDDNSINLLVAIGTLKKYGMICDKASDGLTAVKMVSENDYDIVFMDHMMPGIGGIEATAMIRDLGEKYHALPVVALTANAIVNGREKFIAEGLDDYISKPIDPAQLDEVLLRNLPENKIKTDE
ncbi:MAG: response regulator [Clostridia bacterium]|nr:response regulator [Clostridia bacterium]